MQPPAEVLGLRERKKARTRQAIQHHALRLFRERGYEATTVSQIAEAAEVSESTFFRYYATKEAVVFEDEFDAPLAEALAAQPPQLGLMPAMRAAVRAVLGELEPSERAELRNRIDLFMSVPELRAAFAERFLDTIDQTAALLAARTGRPAEDLQVRTLAGALVGALMAVTFLPSAGEPDDYVERIDAVLAQLEDGFSF